MKFAALLSGGKDSCYSILKCIEFGHELVALVNLFPPSGNNNDIIDDEMNSFMYQTAAHSAIPKLAECIGVPLVRVCISGGPSCQSLEYAPTAGDEVEDLFCAVQEVLRQFPELQAVSCGAIVSNYQRTRVENVCGRLGLQSLAYLWELDRSTLLQEMLVGASFPD
jgi:diphthine-ammonia ligase